MSPAFAARLARRELRAGKKRFALYMSAITVGVAALVSINSFRENVMSSVHSQVRSILGADLELSHRNAFPVTIDSLIDSLAHSGIPVSRVVSFGSMVLATGSERAPRLLQIRALDGNYPYYGTIATEPAEAWLSFQNARDAIVEEAAMLYLDTQVGDSIAIGNISFRIAGVLKEFPGNLGIRAAVGPRVFISLRYLDDTGLIRFGSLARFRAYMQMEDHHAVELFLGDHDEVLDANQIRYSTVADVEADLSSVLDRLARFLGLIGLVALLLGGIAVASAVHVLVKEKLNTIALLRCLGADQPTVFAAYTILALFLGVGGALAGAMLGIAVQASLPRLLQDFLPLDVTFSVQWITVLSGIAVGVWVATIFALLPLLKIRGVSPLRALRREVEPTKQKRDLFRWATFAALVASVVALSMWQAPEPVAGAAFATAIGATTGLLASIAWLMIRAAKKFFPRNASYVIRQGIANLFRPHNQTISVTLGIGFGVFLIATLHLTQGSLLSQLSVESSPNRTNLVMFDVQADQREGLEQLLARRGHPDLGIIPIVPSRISKVNGVTVEDIMSDSSAGRGDRWMYTREYRNTYRARLSETEVLTAGAWWDEKSASDAPRISIDEDIAAGLNIDLGDRITWDIQGVELETEISSLRRINWARFEPNFFVVFEPGVLEQAPQTFIHMTRIEDTRERVQVQRSVVGLYPNIAMFDLTNIQRTINLVISKVGVAIRFMATFSIVSGLIVLVGAITTTKFQRIQEGALLKTLGASTWQIRQILLTEYATLGAVAGLTGLLLAVIAGWALAHYMFEVAFELPTGSLLFSWILVVGLTVLVGLANSRAVTRHTPLATLRELSE